MRENALSIFIIFPDNYSKPRPQPESYVFSDVAVKFSVWHLETTYGKQMRESWQKLRQLLKVASTAGSCGRLPS